MKTRYLFVAFAFSLLSWVSVFGQNNDNAMAEAVNEKENPENNASPLPQLIVKGNNLLKKEHFIAAREVWAETLKEDPENANINFKLGLCYRKSMDEQQKALPYFQKAVKSVTKDYNFYNADQQNAPREAIYFLAETYLAMNFPDSAFNYFTKYRNAYEGSPPVDVEQKIMNCVNARKNLRAPRDVSILNMGGGVNTEYPETNPVITIDNSIMFFASRRLRKDNSNIDNIDPKTGKYREDIYIANKDNEGHYRNATIFPVNSTNNEAPLCLSADGLTLYFKREENNISNIYTSSFEDGVWNKEKAVSAVNSPFNETGVTISEDGNFLYFTSDRAGGKGDYDIYQLVKKSNGKWSAPKNISSLNTGMSETSPFIHPNGKTLFYSSNGYKYQGMGGYDIYYSEMKDDGSWGEPQNLGYPINTTKDDMHYYITSGGLRYYTRINKDKSYDLFKITGGGYDVENLSVNTEVVTLTKEMDVAQVLEIEKEVEKEVEVVEMVETEVIKEQEVEVVDLTALEELEVAKGKDPEVARAEAEKAKAEAEIAKAEAEKKRAEAEIAAAERAKAEAEKLKARAEIAAAEKAKADAEILKAQKEIYQAEAEIARAVIQKATADSLNAVSIIAAAEKAKADAAKAKEERIAAKDKAVVAEAEKAKAAAKQAEEERLKAQAEADKEKALAQQKKAEAEKAASEKAKAEAEIAAAEKLKANAKLAEEQRLKAEAEATKEKAAAETAASEKAKAEAEAAKLEAEAKKKKAEAEIATAEKAKVEAKIVEEERLKAQAEADKQKALAEQKKAEAEKAAAEQAKSEADAKKATEEKAKAEAAAEEAKAMAKKKEEERLEAEAAAKKAAAEKEKAKEERLKAEAEAKKEKALAEQKKAEAEKAAAEQAKAEANLKKAAEEKAKAEAEAEKARAEAEKKKAEAELNKSKNEGKSSDKYENQ